MDIVAASMNAILDRALKVVLPEGEDERILRSAQQLSARRLARPVVLGAPAEVQPGGHPSFVRRHRRQPRSKSGAMPDVL